MRCGDADEHVIDPNIGDGDFFQPESWLRPAFHQKLSFLFYDNVVGFISMAPMKHLLLFAATTGYQIRVFADAARRLGAELTLHDLPLLEDPGGIARCAGEVSPGERRWCDCVH